jgi:hypothetical protein
MMRVKSAPRKKQYVRRNGEVLAVVIRIPKTRTKLPSGKIVVKTLPNQPTPGSPRLVVDPKTGLVTAASDRSK